MARMLLGPGKGVSERDPAVLCSLWFADRIAADCAPPLQGLAGLAEGERKKGERNISGQGFGKILDRMS